MAGAAARARMTTPEEPVQPVPGSAPLPRLESVNGRACSRSDGGARLEERDPPRDARASSSLTCGAAPETRGARRARRAEATAGCASTGSSSHSLAASLGDPPQLPAHDARGGALWRREASRAAPQTLPLAALPVSAPGWRRHVGASGLRKRRR